MANFLWVLFDGTRIQCLRVGTQENATQWNRETRLTGKQGRWVKVRGGPLPERVKNLARCCTLCGQATNCAERTPIVSGIVDAALCDLIAKIDGYSDDFFDAHWMQLEEVEIEALVALLLQHWTEQLSGRLLGSLLLIVREQRGGG